MDTRAHHELIDMLVAFIERVGIEVVAAEIDSSFLPGVAIAHGRLLVDRARLRWPGDLLHEAGHIAVTPPAQRALLSDALDAAALIEVEAIAWSWAALMALNLEPTLLFHPHGYRGQAASLLFTFTHGIYPGAAGLARAGMTALGDATERGVPPYPHMLAWLRT